MEPLDIRDALFPLFEEAFPVESGCYTIDVVHGDEPPLRIDSGTLYAVFRVIEWDSDARDSVMSITEKEIVVCDQRVHELPERLAAGLRAHAIVQRTLLLDPPLRHGAYMADDFFDHKVFRLKSVRTVEDFVRSLATKSRLNVPELLGYEG